MNSEKIHPMRIELPMLSQNYIKPQSDFGLRRIQVSRTRSVIFAQTKDIESRVTRARNKLNQNLHYQLKLQLLYSFHSH